MFAYIVRRLLWAVALLFVLSVVTFSIFYVVPRLAGASPETLAAVTWGGLLPRRRFIDCRAARPLDPVPVQYWNWIKGVFTGAEYDYGAGVESCPAPCSAIPSSPGRQCGLNCSTGRQ